MITIKTFVNEQILKLEDFIKDLEKNFLKYVETYVNKYELNKYVNIYKIYLYIFINYDIKLKNSLVKDKNKELVIVNFPQINSIKGDIKLSSFLAVLHPFLLELEIPHNVKKILFLISFNKEPKIILEKLEKNKNEEKSNFIDNNIAFYPILPRYRFEQIILNNKTIYEIKKTLTILRHKDLLYNKWGFKEIEPSPRAILNFYGPPGTGKTITAHAIAHELGLKILTLNYADIESKFVGEAPKNLVNAFKIAEKENSVIFFDEADSFLGKRIASVSSASDQAINSLRSQMLILLENFSGIVIFATNFLKNYDRAFETRIFKHIKFDLPDESIRIKLIEKMIPSKAPINKLQEDQLFQLSKISEGFSGRDIKNSILNAFISVIYEKKEYISFEDLKKSFIEYKNMKENIEKEYLLDKNNLDNRYKKKLEEKIMKNLEKNKENMFNLSILKIAFHAALIDGLIQSEEKEILLKIINTLNLNVEIPKDRNHLPPLKKLVSDLKNKEEKINTLNLVINLIAADGNIDESEKKFIIQLIELLNIPKEEHDKILDYMLKLAKTQKDWKNLLNILNYKNF